MNFEEWYEQDETIVPNDIERYDLETAWNAAIDEAVKVATDYGNITEEEEMEGATWLRDTPSKIANKIKELKE